MRNARGRTGWRRAPSVASSRTGTAAAISTLRLLADDAPDRMGLSVSNTALIVVTLARPFGECQNPVPFQHTHMRASLSTAFCELKGIYLVWLIAGSQVNANIAAMGNHAKSDRSRLCRFGTGQARSSKQRQSEPEIKLLSFPGALVPPVACFRFNDREGKRV